MCRIYRNNPTSTSPAGNALLNFLQGSCESCELCGVLCVTTAISKYNNWSKGQKSIPGPWHMLYEGIYKIVLISALRSAFSMNHILSNNRDSLSQMFSQLLICLVPVYSDNLCSPMFPPIVSSPIERFRKYTPTCSQGFDVDRPTVYFFFFARILLEKQSALIDNGTHQEQTK